MENSEFLQALNGFEQSVLLPQTGMAGAQAVNLYGIYRFVAPVLKGFIPYAAAPLGFGAATAAGRTALTAVLDAVYHGFSSQSVSVGPDHQSPQAIQDISASKATPYACGAQSVDLCATWQKALPIQEGLIPAKNMHPPVIVF